MPTSLADVCCILECAHAERCAIGCLLGVVSVARGQVGRPSFVAFTCCIRSAECAHAERWAGGLVGVRLCESAVRQGDGHPIMCAKGDDKGKR